MRIRMVLVFLLAALLSPLVLASGGGGGDAGKKPMVFTVNLGSRHYLRVEVALDMATPEVAHEIELFRPKVQHAVILLLSERDEASLRTLQGKKILMADIREAINHLIHSDPESGVKDVLFPSFIIE